MPGSSILTVPKDIGIRLYEFLMVSQPPGTRRLNLKIIASVFTLWNKKSLMLACDSQKMERES